MTLGWNPNDEATWVIPSGLSAEDTAFLQNIIAIDADPNTKTDQQLKEADVFHTNLRRATFEKFLSNESTRAEALGVLENYISSIIWTGATTVDEFRSMSPEQVQALVESLTREQLSELERKRANINHEKFTPTGLEQIQWVKEKKVGYNENSDGKGNIIGSGPYGWWVNNAFNPDFMSALAEVEYTVPVLGRTTFEGQPIVLRGDFSGDVGQGLLEAILDLPYGNTGILMLMQDANGQFHRTLLQVSVDGQSEIISNYPVNTGYWAPGGLFVGAPPTVTLTSTYKEGNAGQKLPLTTSKLLEMVGEKYRWIQVISPFVSGIDENGNDWPQSMFFSELGIPVFGNTVENSNGNRYSPDVVFYGLEE